MYMLSFPTALNWCSKLEKKAYGLVKTFKLCVCVKHLLKAETNVLETKKNIKPIPISWYPIFWSYLQLTNSFAFIKQIFCLLLTRKIWRETKPVEQNKKTRNFLHLQLVGDTTHCLSTILCSPDPLPISPPLPLASVWSDRAFNFEVPKSQALQNIWEQMCTMFLDGYSFLLFVPAISWRVRKSLWGQVCHRTNL